ncbi:hypothetical protein [Hyphococcus sp.]|uniref:hypothetical protein n=1 Tax=Hyphococcus sp. TaxID=2038636 RepID=UPI003CCB741E
MSDKTPVEGGCHCGVLPAGRKNGPDGFEMAAVNIRYIDEVECVSTYARKWKKF